MTVSYSAEFASSSFSVFFKVLWKWKGSLYSLVWKSFVMFLLFYILLYVIFDNLLTPGQQRAFMEVSEKAEKLLGIVPLAFILGFYTDIVLSRWWRCFSNIPYPDTLGMLISTYIHGLDERPRLMRRTIMRYINLSFINVFRTLAVPTKKRFPTADHLVAAGMLNENEKEILLKFAPGDIWWVPLIWSSTLVSKARSEGFIRDQHSALLIIKELMKFRSGLGSLLGQDWISFPLVYTQVVMVAVYSFCVLCLFGRQTFTIHDTSTPLQTVASNSTSANLLGSGTIITHPIDYSAPFRTLLQFAFYIGWLKAAEVCLNPMGEDDDDFPVNWIIDRNINISYLLIDEMHQECPTLSRDTFWDMDKPQLPYTEATKRFITTTPFEGSAAKVSVNVKASEFLLPPIIEEVEGSSKNEFDNKMITTSGKPSVPLNIRNSLPTNDDTETPLLNFSVLKANESIKDLSIENKSIVKKDSKLSTEVRGRVKDSISAGKPSATNASATDRDEELIFRFSSMDVPITTQEKKV